MLRVTYGRADDSCEKADICLDHVETQIRSLGSTRIPGRVGILGVLDKIAAETKKPIDEIRVLEIGAGSACLAERLICYEYLSPSKYVISDIVYGTYQAPVFPESISANIRVGVLNAINRDLFESPGKIGKFDLILMSFLLGLPKFLSALIENYFDCLDERGMMIATSAQYTNSIIRALIEKAVQKPCNQTVFLNDEEKDCLNFLQRLRALVQQGKIPEYTNPLQFFHNNASDLPSLTFILQRS